MKKLIYKFYCKPKKSQNYLVAVAIGSKCISEWKNFALHTWLDYCKRNDVGLLVFHDYLVPKISKVWKSATWQKHLVGSYILKNINNIENVCLLDTDILINPFSPNIFDHLEKNKISVVSHLKNLPYSNSENTIRRKIAFNRRLFYSKKFPLDSALTMNNKQLFNYHGWKDPGNYFCFGVFVFNVKKFSNFLTSTYYKYSVDIKSLTAGNEPFINYEVQTKCKIKWLDYKFQTYWNYECIEKYPFLYKFKRKLNKTIKDCVEASLQECYFMHFSGSWYDSDHWMIKGIFQNKTFKLNYEKFLKYKLKKLQNKAHKHRILPKGKSIVKKT
jgi:hypothetical protein